MKDEKRGIPMEVLQISAREREKIRKDLLKEVYLKLHNICQ
jgi:hypothetical protein